MKYFLFFTCIWVLTSCNQPESKTQFSFNSGLEQWEVVEDSAMGGKSEAAIATGPDGLVFIGTISTVNQGGFTIAKSPLGDFDLSSAKNIKIKCRGNGLTMALLLELEEGEEAPYLLQKIEGVGRDWREIHLPIDSFKTYQGGLPTDKSLSSESLRHILRLGLVNFARVEGEFSFEVADIWLE